MSPRKNHVSRKVMDLALQWMRDEVSTSEVQKRVSCKSVNQAVYRMGIAIRQAKRMGMLREAE